MNSARFVKPVIAAAVAFVVAAAAGVPLGYLWFLAVILACPAMMLIMMWGMGHTPSRDESAPSDRAHEHH